jgi:hypothetical protein
MAPKSDLPNKHLLEGWSKASSQLLPSTLQGIIITLLIPTPPDSAVCFPNAISANYQPGCQPPSDTSANYVCSVAGPGETTHAYTIVCYTGLQPCVAWVGRTCVTHGHLVVKAQHSGTDLAPCACNEPSQPRHMVQVALEERTLFFTLLHPARWALLLCR